MILYGLFADQTTSILDPDMGIGQLLGLVVNILSYGLGAAAVIGVVVAGVMYLTARDNESQVAVAKQRLLNTVMGLIAWVVLFSVVNWLIPGGVPDPEAPENNITSQDRHDENPIEGGGAVGGGSDGTTPPNSSECQAHPKRKDCFETYTSQEQMMSAADSFYAANESDLNLVFNNLFTVYAEKGYSFANVPQEYVEAMSCSAIDTLHYKVYNNGDNAGLKVIDNAASSKGCELG